jgi:hypothetical protein
MMDGTKIGKTTSSVSLSLMFYIKILKKMGDPEILRPSSSIQQKQEFLQKSPFSLVNDR